MIVHAAVLAAGEGARFGSDKASAVLRGRPLWRWSFDALRSHPEVAGVGIVASPANLGRVKSEAQGALFAIAGGSSRQDSSRLAVEAMPEETGICLLHDAARPFVSARLTSSVVSAARDWGAAVPGLGPHDTIKERIENGYRTLDRLRLIAVQTPQAARRDWLLKAHREAASEFTDESSLLEAAGFPCEVVAGDPENIKITLPEDLARAERFLGAAETRTGIGYDIHPFSSDAGRPLYLGGAEIPGSPGLEGHSDADALAHAAVDALLGAAGLGDIGEHFPNTDARWKDARSTLFLAHAAKLLQDAGWSVSNLDATVIAESPRLAERIGNIRSSLADALGIEPARVNVKATTNEGLGWLGQGKGIAAMAIATIVRISS